CQAWHPIPSQYPDHRGLRKAKMIADPTRARPTSKPQRHKASLPPETVWHDSASPTSKPWPATPETVQQFDESPNHPPQSAQHVVDDFQQSRVHDGGT